MQSITGKCREIPNRAIGIVLPTAVGKTIAIESSRNTLHVEVYEKRKGKCESIMMPARKMTIEKDMSQR